MQAQGTSCHQRQVSNAGSLRAHASSRAHPRCPKAFSSQILQRAQRRRALRGASLQVLSAAQPVTSSAGPKSSGSSNGSEVYDVVVVGAGVSGLTTALALQSEHGSEVQRLLVTEGRDRVGGNVTTVANPQEGYLWEEGPNSFQPSDAILKAAVDAGIEKDLVLGDPTAPRFVYWDGKLRPTPSGLDALTFDLMSIWGKIRAGLGVVGLKAPMPDFEENIEQFIKRNLGDEVFYRLIEPFCSGVYAGNPAKLSMKAAFGKVWELEKKGGSIIGGTFKLMQERKANPAPPRDPRLPPKPKGQTVGSFRQGLKMLPEAIAAKLGGDKVRTGWQLENIYKDGDLYKLTYKTPQGTQEVRSRVVALTVPAYVAADLVRREAPEAAEALKSLDYPPVAAVTLSYPKSAVRQDRFDGQGNVPGFGQLHPRTQGVTTLGTIYSSSLFPGRAPDGQILLLNYIGGALNRGIVDQKEDDLVAQVDKDLRKMLLRPDAPAPRKIAVRVWPKAIPQFNVGHLDVVQAARDDLADAGWEGVLLGGNYVSGVALGKCIEYGYEYAKQVAQTCKRAGSGAATRNGDETFFV